ncbi:hypothetical protein BV22DRAFT_1016295 [Leucogyrophana mollusca]|uniref:Uncharacterized protein n=1 Tax=Leucogyrophana mollusca TaxID=85980 RepID=A0ACB8BCE9_9AGAM|nr:hypothetical protein BV22DRAFT_1016295 [Leucogyrophana mollusca]
MNSLRQRIPFKYPSDSSSTEEPLVLDEQEQDELIDKLRTRNSTSDRQHRLGLQLTIALSCILHLVYLFSDQDSPLFAMFPAGPSGKGSPLPLSRLVTMVDVLFHVNLGVLVHPWPMRGSHIVSFPLSYMYAFAWSAIPPTLSLLAGKAWQTTAWWSMMLITTWVSHVVQAWIEETDEGFSEFEKMKYQAAGA